MSLNESKGNMYDQETIDRISTNEHDKGDGDLRRVICCAGLDRIKAVEATDGRNRWRNK